MSGTESLIQAFESGALTRPRHDRPNLVDLARAIAKLSGVCGLDLSPSAAEVAAKIGEADHIVLIMADGVGMNFVESMPRSSFLLRSLQDELLTVFPSTTSVALTSLTTCEWPGRHAITGWWTHLPDLGSSATILQYTARNGGRDLRGRGIDPKRAFPVKSIWSSIQTDTQIMVPKSIAGSVYSRYFSGGRDTVAYASLSEGIDRAIRRVQRAEGRTFTYLYTPRVDTLAHRHGVSRPEVRHGLTEVDNELARLHAAVGSKARTVVTADHGFLDAPPQNRHTLRPSRNLLPLLRFPPSGDARVMYLHTWDWARDRVRRHFERRFGDRFIVIDVEDALAMGLFGPDSPSDEASERLGDLIVISAGADVLEYNTERGVGKMLQINSHHSGLSPDEMRIPLVIA